MYSVVPEAAEARLQRAWLSCAWAIRNVALFDCQHIGHLSFQCRLGRTAGLVVGGNTPEEVLWHHALAPGLAHPNAAGTPQTPSG